MARPDSTPSAPTGFALSLERTIAATPERVFAAFTQADQLARWFRPSPDHRCTVPVLEARVGGRYRIELLHPDGRTSVASGTYEEISPPRRLVFSWTWEDKPEHLVSRIIVNIEPQGAGTRLVFVHEQLPTIESAENHKKGWTGCLEALLQQF